MNTHEFLLEAQQLSANLPVKLKRLRGISHYWYGIIAAIGLILLICHWQGSSRKIAIRRVLAADHAIALQVDQRAGFLDKYWNGASLVSKLATEMDKIDLTGCPTDFQLAYKRHVAAWVSMAQVKSSSEGFNAFLKSYISGGQTALSGFSEQESAAKDILQSWSQVQQSAIAHGVAP